MIDRKKLLDIAVTLWALTTIALVSCTFLAWIAGIAYFIYKVVG